MLQRYSSCLLCGAAPLGRGGAPAPPSTRPTIILNRTNQLCLHRIPLNVPANPIELATIPNQPVVALLLPERSAQPDRFVSAPRRDALKRPQQPLDLDVWRDQEMHVVRHDYVGMQIVVAQ